MKEFIYIYNIKQAEFYICDNEIKPVEIGMSGTKVFFKFVRSETKQAFDEWCKRKVC